MINKIKEMLSKDQEVKLECLDRDKYINIEVQNTKDRERILDSNLIVVAVSHDNTALFLNDTHYCIPDIGLAHFRIIEIKPTFDDLINLAIKAVRDGKLLKLDLTQSVAKTDIIRLYLSGESDMPRRFVANSIKDGIDFINSLYTKTFMIDSEEDTENANANDEVLFTNGEKGLFVSRMEKGKYCFISIDGVDYRIPFSLLKGATITQKKGSK